MSNIKILYNGQWLQLFNKKVLDKDLWLDISNKSKLFIDNQWFYVKNPDDLIVCGLLQENFGQNLQVENLYQVKEIQKITDISVGKNHCIFLKDKKLYGFGNNDFGQLNKSSGLYKTPTIIDESRSYNYLSCGQNLSLVVSDGNLYGCGDNQYNQIYSEMILNYSYFKQITYVSKIKKCSCFRNHIMAITEDNELITRGKTIQSEISPGAMFGIGQFDANTTINFTKIQSGHQLFNPSGWQQVCCGDNFTIGINEGRLFGWGINDFGQLGDTTISYYDMPKLLDERNDWIKISCGEGFFCAIRSNGELYTCGKGSNGQIGNGLQNAINDSLYFVGDGFTHVSCGYNHVLAKKQYLLYGWGQNKNKQLINIEQQNVLTCTEIDKYNFFRMFGCGDEISVVLREIN